jgi:hypothetical protein
MVITACYFRLFASLGDLNLIGKRKIIGLQVSGF